MLFASARTFCAAFFAVLLPLGSVQAQPVGDAFANQRKTRQALKAKAKANNEAATTERMGQWSPQTAQNVRACRIAAFIQMYHGSWGLALGTANILTRSITAIPWADCTSSSEPCQTLEQVRAKAWLKGMMR
jgi:hypothetical protein